jgi:hypothetical protein
MQPKGCIFYYVCFASGGGADGSDMGLNAFIPVEEAFHVDDIANLQSFSCFVDFGIRGAEVALY